MHLAISCWFVTFLRLTFLFERCKNHMLLLFGWSQEIEGGFISRMICFMTYLDLLLICIHKYLADADSQCTIFFWIRSFLFQGTLCISSCLGLLFTSLCHLIRLALLNHLNLLSYLGSLWQRWIRCLWCEDTSTFLFTCTWRWLDDTGCLSRMIFN